LHTRRKFVGSVDARAFFPSIRREHVAGLLQARGCGADSIEVLALLLTLESAEEPGRTFLPQGAPTSMAVANLLLFGLDTELAEAARLRGLGVTRLVDGYDFSGSNRAAVLELMEMARLGFERLGLEENRSKRLLMPDTERQVVGGLVVNRGVSVAKREKRKKSASHRSPHDTRVTRKRVRDAVRAALHRGDITPAERRSLLGRVNYVRKHHPSFLRQLAEDLKG
jgi:hypothetical protein